jgi:hypothetical protein
VAEPMSGALNFNQAIASLTFTAYYTISTFHKNSNILLTIVYKQLMDQLALPALTTD